MLVRHQLLCPCSPLQVWFDTPESLAAKYQVASDLGLAGIGMWNLDCLDYESSDPRVQAQTAAMWVAVRQAVSMWPKIDEQPSQEARPPTGGLAAPATS